MESFQVSSTSDGGVSRLALGGEIDLAVAPEIIERGRATFAESAIHTVVVDLAAVTFLDSTAIGALVHLRNGAIEAGKSLQLANVPDRVRKLLKITGLDEVFAVEGDEVPAVDE